ncbi:MAG: hypothetical protein R2731_05935 [Nocardioides sp.]
MPATVDPRQPAGWGGRPTGHEPHPAARRSSPARHDAPAPARAAGRPRPRPHRLRPTSLGRHNDAAVWSAKREVAWRSRGYVLGAFSPRGGLVAGAKDGHVGSVAIFARGGDGPVLLGLGSGYRV